jgi:hypothetical protein
VEYLQLLTTLIIEKIRFGIYRKAPRSAFSLRRFGFRSRIGSSRQIFLCSGDQQPSGNRCGSLVWRLTNRPLASRLITSKSVQSGSDKEFPPVLVAQAAPKNPVFKTEYRMAQCRDLDPDPAVFVFLTVPARFLA